ncbi:MAG: hypothetical protein RIE77_01500 [Phycisphaerales bacterium]|jgi:hypothetical protein
MDQPDTRSQSWTPALAATMIVRFAGAASIVLAAFWLLSWGLYRIEYMAARMPTDQDWYYGLMVLRYLVLGGLLLLFEPSFARWLTGGPLGSGASP